MFSKSVDLLSITFDSQFKFKKPMEVTAGSVFSALFELENKKLLTAEKKDIYAIIITFIYCQNNTALIIRRYDN